MPDMMKAVENLPGLRRDKTGPNGPMFPQLLVPATRGEGHYKKNNKENLPTKPNVKDGGQSNKEILLSNSDVVNQSIGGKRPMYRIDVINSHENQPVERKDKKKKKKQWNSSIESLTVTLHDNIDQDSIQPVKLYNTTTTATSNGININSSPAVNKLKRSKSERIHRQTTFQPDGGNNTKESDCLLVQRSGGLCHSHSVVYKNGDDLPRLVTQRKVPELTLSRSDGFIIKPTASKIGNSNYINYNSNNNTKLSFTEEVGGAYRRKLGDTKALIDRYMNPEPVVYQSDLSFLFKDKSVEQVASTLGSNFATWNKRDISKEQLNMLDLGNSYRSKRKRVDIRSSIEELTEPVHIMKEQSGGKTSSGIQQSYSVSPRSSLKQQSTSDPLKDTVVKTKAFKKVLFNEDTTEILDIHEIEAPIEFAVRIGRQSTDVLSNHRDSIVSTPIDSSYSGTPVPPKPILKSKSSLEPENINWADCYQLSSGEESDTCSDPGSYSYKDYLHGAGSSSRLSLPTLSLSGSLVSRSNSNHRNMVSPRTRHDVTSPGSRKSRSRGSNKSNSFQCSKEFALVLQNLDSDDEES